MILLDAAFEYVQGTTKHGGLVVASGARVVYERYFGMGSAEATPNLASVGKAFTSIAVGILMPDRLDQKVAPLLGLKDPRKQEIRLGHLLAMSSGLRGNNPCYVRGKPVTIDPAGPDGWQAMVDQTALNVGMWCEPGAGYSYATAGVHLASMIVRRVAGMELEVFLAERLMRPLGFGRWGFGYLRPELRHTPGGGGVAVRSADMLKFGRLLLQQDRWENRQIVPRGYVRQCGRLTRYNPHFPYSFQFEVNGDGHVKGAPRDAFWKSGSGGHCIYVVPSLNLVVWKLGGREEQYRELAWEGVRYDGSREAWKPAGDITNSTERTLELVVEAMR